MAVTSAQVSVAATAVALNTDSVSGTRLVVRNAGAASVHLGPSTVTTSNGFELAADATVTVILSHGEQLFAIGDAVPDTVHVLRSGG